MTLFLGFQPDFCSPDLERLLVQTRKNPEASHLFHIQEHCDLLADGLTLSASHRPDWRSDREVLLSHCTPPLPWVRDPCPLGTQ